MRCGGSLVARRIARYRRSYCAAAERARRLSTVALQAGYKASRQPTRSQVSPPADPEGLAATVGLRAPSAGLDLR